MQVLSNEDGRKDTMANGKLQKKLKKRRMPIDASKRKKARHPIKKPEKEDNVKTNKRPLLKGYKTTSLVPNPEKKKHRWSFCSRRASSRPVIYPKQRKPAQQYYKHPWPEGRIQAVLGGRG